MEVNFAPEIEKKIAQSPAQQGCNPDDLIQEVVSRYFDEERRFMEAVHRGEAALQRGDRMGRTRQP